MPRKTILTVDGAYLAAATKLLAVLVFESAEESAALLACAARCGLQPSQFPTSTLCEAYALALAGNTGSALRENLLGSGAIAGLDAVRADEDYRYRSNATAETWCRSVVQGHTQRRVTTLATRLTNTAGDLTAAKAVSLELENVLTNASTVHSADLLTAEACGVAYAEELSALEVQRAAGTLLETGYKGLDSLMGPLLPGDTTILAARTSVGKSKAAANIASHVLDRGKPAAFFSLEMRRQQVFARMLSADTGFATQLDNPNTVRAAALAYSARPLYVCDTPSITAQDIVTRCRYAPVRPKLVVVDYLGIMQHPVTSNTTEAWAIGQSLKVLRAGARELGFHLLLLSQINRAGAEHEEPELHHLRGSGDIEQDAEYVILLYMRKGALVAKLAKNRVTGLCGRVGLRPVGESCKLLECPVP